MQLTIHVPATLLPLLRRYEELSARLESGDLKEIARTCPEFNELQDRIGTACGLLVTHAYRTQQPQQ